MFEWELIYTGYYEQRNWVIAWKISKNQKCDNEAKVESRSIKQALTIIAIANRTFSGRFTRIQYIQVWEYRRVID